MNAVRPSAEAATSCGSGPDGTRPIIFSDTGSTTTSIWSAFDSTSNRPGPDCADNPVDTMPTESKATGTSNRTFNFFIVVSTFLATTLRETAVQHLGIRPHDCVVTRTRRPTRRAPLEWQRV